MSKKITNLELVDHVLEFIRTHALVSEGQRILIACSGGSDSISLLDILLQLAARLKIFLGVIHVDHRQRPESIQAKKYVEKFCKDRGVVFYAHDMDSQVAPPGCDEATLRELRLTCFNKTAKEHGFHRLALGHTRDDQVETVLMRIFRGTGIYGLQGMGFVRDDFFIRPLLGCTRNDLVEYLRVRKIDYFYDRSNQDISFLRNRIRHELLPYLRRWINPAVDTALMRMSKSAAREQDLIEQLAARVEMHADDQGAVVLSFKNLEVLHDAVLARVLIRAVEIVRGPGANLELHHLENLLQNLRSRSDLRWRMELPGALRFEVSYGKVRLSPVKTMKDESFSICIPKPGEYHLPFGDTKLCFRRHDAFEPESACVNQVFFDGREAAFPFLVRSLRPGDRIKLWAGKGSRKVARLLIDAKIPRYLRYRVPLLVKDNQILWVAGIRRSNAASVKPTSQEIISVSFINPPWRDSASIHSNDTMVLK